MHGVAPPRRPPLGAGHVEIEAVDPDAMAERWARVLGRPVVDRTITLDEGAITFVPAGERGDGVAGFVLVIACANVANLTLGRVLRRRDELAVRASIGAGAGALRRQLLIENLKITILVLEGLSDLHEVMNGSRKTIKLCDNENVTITCIGQGFFHRWSADPFATRDFLLKDTVAISKFLQLQP